MFVGRGEGEGIHSWKNFENLENLNKVLYCLVYT